ncbi:MAG: GAF domain-containing protein [Bacteroidia bacterium]|nr:GAF domain-containing protein [Bacteroidia bacterium]
MAQALLATDEKRRLFDQILPRLDEILTSTMPREEKLDFVVNLLRNDVPHYDWVGFYLVDPTEDRTLVLGPYAGEPTDHTRIAFGQGICGQAAVTGQNFIVQDVSKETNYLSCSIHVKSEIVLPIFFEGRMTGQIDIDSHSVAPFTAEDEQFLAAVCQKVAPVL